MISTVVYLLCAATSLLCAILLYLKYRRSKTKLLFWSAICFSGLALNNILLVIDVVVLGQSTDLSTWRVLPAAFGLTALVMGLAWESL